MAHHPLTKPAGWASLMSLLPAHEHPAHWPLCLPSTSGRSVDLTASCLGPSNPPCGLSGSSLPLLTYATVVPSCFPLKPLTLHPGLQREALSPILARQPLLQRHLYFSPPPLIQILKL